MADTNEEDSDMEDMITDSDIELSMSFDEKFGKQKTTQEFVYEVLTIAQIVKQMQERIQEVKAVIHMPSPIIRTLLKYFKWDTQKLLEQLFDTNQDQLFSEVGIALKANTTSRQSKRLRLSVKHKNNICLICLTEVDIKALFGLDCGHDYCKGCWNQYLTTKVMSEGNVSSITCAQTDCNVVVDDDQFLELVSEPNVRIKYQRLTTDSYVESNRLLRWCPKPDCLHAFSVKTRDSQPVTCVCGAQICFGCGEDNHEPIDCELLRQWMKKSAGNNAERLDGKTANWIVTNTKECPKCRTTIEKNGGCNHMTCRSIKCKYEFCWVCLESWTTHGTSYYNCNRYKESKAKQMKESQSDGRKELERFMFYWQRFMNHKQSLKFENELKNTVKAKMNQMQDRFGMTWVEVQFMAQAVEVLCSCRQTLMYTYVFAYYTRPIPQLDIFEDNQRDLQKAVETLSEYLEKDLNVDEDRDIRSRVLHSSNYCQLRRKALIDHIREGIETDVWKYSFD